LAARTGRSTRSSGSRGSAGRTGSSYSRTGSRRRRRNRRRRSWWTEGGTIKVLLAVIAAFCLLGFIHFRNLADTARTRDLSDEVLAYQGTVERIAAEEGVGDYTPYLLAIMQVESKGQGNDVMQSSESLGLSPNSLGPEESIRQACVYFAALLKIAGNKECDILSVIQAYNFGPGYLDYVAGKGGKHSFKLAEEFSGEKASWNKTKYMNPVAIARNGGWRYTFGNMFYADLVTQYLIL
jgi:hypothetical protein